MKIPKRLEPLITEGLVDDVIRPLMSGKEADVYVVRSGGVVRCAKVYKDANLRSFHKRAVYTEGRRVKDSRRARAMKRGSRFGRESAEEDWQNAEVTALYRLAARGVRVPAPYGFSQGVLIMEMVVDSEGEPALRLNDLTFSKEDALAHHAFLIRQVVNMLCEGLIHGDLSEYNILLGVDGPVIIDLPQAIEAAANNSARDLFIRDVQNLAAYFGRFAPELLTTHYGEEIWRLFECGQLHPDSPLTGKRKRSTKKANVKGVLQEIDAEREHAERRQVGGRRRGKRGGNQGSGAPGAANLRGVIDERWSDDGPRSGGRPKTGGRPRAGERPKAGGNPAAPDDSKKSAANGRSRRRRRKPKGPPQAQPAAQKPTNQAGPDHRRRRRPRRRRGSGSTSKGDSKTS